MTEPVIVPSGDLERLCRDLLASRSVRQDVLEQVTTSLLQTSLRGVDSHGIELLPHYVRALDAGRINGAPDYRFEQTGAATARLGADHTFGHAAGATAVDRAMSMAVESGAAIVSVYDSTHFGAAAFFALRAAERGYLGLSFTHADALMLSAGGTRPFFGTNPICFAAPCRDEEPFCLDMATSFVSWNKILRYRASGAALPAGWGFDAEGDPTLDAGAVRALAPAGEYKGFGLSMMIDILCGLLAGMPVGRDISRMYADPIEQRRHLGHFFMVIDIARFIDPVIFRDRLQELMNRVRTEPAKDPSHPVMVPGDPEKLAFRRRSIEGIPVSRPVFEQFQALGAAIGSEL